MADVVTDEGRKGIKVGKAMDGRLDARLADHARDPQWASFKVLKTWYVRDEDTTETALLDTLKLRTKPIHGLETFCHSINPQNITRRFMGDSMPGGLSGWLFWECDKFSHSIKAMNRGIDGRSWRGTNYKLMVLLCNLFMVAILAAMVAVAVAAWVVDGLIIPVIRWTDRMAGYVAAFIVEEMESTTQNKQLPKTLESLYAKKTSDFPEPPPVPQHVPTQYAKQSTDFPMANPLTN